MKTFKAIFTTLPMLMVSALFLFHTKNSGIDKTIANIFVFLIMNVCFFLMVFTGKTYRYRAIIFIAAALLFPTGFIYHNIIERGSMLLSFANIYECKIPFCHLVTPMLIIPVALAKSIPFPGYLTNGYASISSMLILLISAMIVIGRGWCSWGCFFGGWDEGTSKFGNKAFYSLSNRFWKLLPYAVLVFAVLLSAYTLSPAYCTWLCPFKAITEFKKVTNIQSAIQMIIFFSMFIIFLFILPILTKKRAQCSCFCPLGPTIIAFFNRFNIFDVKIDKIKCINCKKCIRICPLNAIDDDSLAKGQTSSQCAKCARCIDECPTHAIMYYVKGTKLGVNPDAARLIYLYSAWTLMTAVLGTIMASSIATILKIVFQI